MNDTDAKRDHLPHICSAIIGAVVYILIASVTANPVAWSSVSYFALGWPLMCAGAWLVARSFPLRSWRWPVSMMLGQIFASILYGNGALIPVAIAYVTVLSIPQFVVVAITSKAILRQSSIQDESKSL
jgi:uncharacterized membrane protein HdeD (DUF308 family)